MRAFGQRWQSLFIVLAAVLLRIHGNEGHVILVLLHDKSIFVNGVELVVLYPARSKTVVVENAEGVCRVGHLFELRLHT